MKATNFITIENLLIQIFLATAAIVMLYPIFMMVLSGFKTTPEIFMSPFSMPKKFNIENFQVIWEKTNVPRYFLNSNNSYRVFNSFTFNNRNNGSLCHFKI